MKANGAPEKIYISPNSEESTYYVSNQYNRLIEYTRTDAFVEKATKWLLTNASDYCILHNSYDTKELVEDFVNAMKRD